MALNWCDLCNDPCLKGQIGDRNQDQAWRTLIAQALCAIGLGGAPQTPLPEVSLGFATLQASYASYADPGFMDGQTRLRKLRINNTVDAVIEVSLDGGTTTYMTVPASSDTGVLDLGNLVLSAASDFKIRRASGDTATSGTLYIQGSY